MSALEQRISAQEEAILLDGEERPAHVEDHGGGHRVMLSGLPGAMPSPPQRVSSDEILGDGDGNGSTNSNHGDGSSPSGQRGSREGGRGDCGLAKGGLYARAARHGLLGACRHQSTGRAGERASRRALTS